MGIPIRQTNMPTVFGIGYYGRGEEVAHIKGGADSVIFRRWRSMLRRCYYQPYKKHRRCYDGVTVAKEWLSFQAFALWYRINYPSDGRLYRLTRLRQGARSKLYSANTCSFVAYKNVNNNMLTKKIGSPSRFF